ncbi:hypothetical protein D9619_008180 [Psilocybe cf. subviscida]|uniref:Uncharacterized protein n=1 Tax=Psilocybe cf. subviscida TaxID=2480587 RepID=A0A8H5ESN3_9AGAR|nr:hypothetical protein D9619_008180 [Psilocybe cf. subviscida]
MIIEDDDWDALASELVRQNYAFVAVLVGSSHSVANQHLATVYTFTLPAVVVSIGTCRYLLRVEKDRARLGKLAESINTADGKGNQSVDEEQLHHDSLPRQNQYRHSYPPRLPTGILPASDREASGFLTQHFSSELGGCTPDTVFSNFPYLHGARSYISRLRRNRSSMAITITTDSTTNHSALSSLSARRSSRGSGPSFHAGCAAEPEATDAVEQNDIVSEQNYSASNIEIGSLQSSSSVDSEELRQFDNVTWNVEPFMAGGSWYSIP